MGYFKLLNKLFPASPDAILKRATDAEAAVARMAHVNPIINDLSDISFYTLELDQSTSLPINSNKGIIEIEKLYDASLVPDPAFDTNTVITLVNNPVLNIANRDKVYLQTSIYYSPVSGDEFAPYVIASGYTPLGLDLKIYNASPIPNGGTNGKGTFYLYYEIKTLA